MPSAPSRLPRAASHAPDVGAIVVCHDQATPLARCLESLRACRGGATLDVVVVDSGSDDGVESVAGQHGAEYIGGPNAGYAAAINRALRSGLLGQPRYLLLANPDTEIAEGTLADLVAAADQRSRCGVFGPRQVDQTGQLLCTMARTPSPRDCWEAWRTGRPDWYWEAERYEHEARSDWVSGSWMLVRGRALDQVGALDERFFLYSEEVDLCRRMADAGWEVAYLPVVTVKHAMAGRHLDAHLERLLAWSQLIYNRKWFGPAERASMRLAMTLFAGRSWWQRLRAGHGAEQARVRLLALLRFRRPLYGPRPGPGRPRDGPCVPPPWARPARDGMTG